MLWSTTENRVRISKVTKVEEKFASAFGSSSSKKQGGDGYIYSNWIVVFLGDARKMIDTVSEGCIITVKKWRVSNEKYDKADGTTVYNNPKLIVSDFDVYRVGNGKVETPQAGTGAEIPNEDDIPF